LSGASGGDLEIRGVRVEDEGFYVCSLSNAASVKYAQAQLVVNGSSTLSLLYYLFCFIYIIHYYLIFISILVAASFLRKPQDQQIAEGNTAEFYCSTSGKPKPIIVWKKDGKCWCDH
jgi:hypothetical protein